MHLNGSAQERRVCAECLPTLKETRFTGAQRKKVEPGLRTRSDFYLKINQNQPKETRNAFVKKKAPRAGEKQVF